MNIWSRSPLQHLNSKTKSQTIVQQQLCSLVFSRFLWPVEEIKVVSKSSKGNETIKVLAYKSFSKSLQKRGNLEENWRKGKERHQLDMGASCRNGIWQISMVFSGQRCTKRSILKTSYKLLLPHLCINWNSIDMFACVNTWKNTCAYNEWPLCYFQEWLKILIFWQKGHAHTPTKITRCYLI